MEYYALTLTNYVFAQVVETGIEEPRMREMVDELAAMIPADVSPDVWVFSCCFPI